MSDVTRILSAIEGGDSNAAAQLLPLVYGELRALAAARMAVERPDHTLDATALVHEAYLRLVGSPGAIDNWQSRGHFFAAAAEAMRRILVENARHRSRLKHGGGQQRVQMHADLAAAPVDDEEILALDGALAKLERHDPIKARLVELRFFAGLSGEKAAEMLGISPSTADRHWLFARAWLRRDMDAGDPAKEK